MNARINVLLLVLCLAAAANATPHYPRNFHDPGVDVGLVNKTTTLFSQPDAGSDKIATLKPGDWTVLASRQPTDGFFNVVKLSTGREGWVRADRVNVRYTHHPNKSVDLSTESTGTENPPVIDVENTSEKDIYLHIAGEPEAEIPAHDQKELQVTPGVSSFNASAANVVPLFGSKAFLTGERYTWKFWIAQGGADSAKTDVDPGIKSEAQALQAQINTERGDLTLTKHMLDNEQAALNALGDKIKTEKANTDAKRASVDQTNQAYIDDYNHDVDTLNADRENYHTSLDRYNDDVGSYNDRLVGLKAKEKRLGEIADTINRR